MCDAACEIRLFCIRRVFHEKDFRFLCVNFGMIFLKMGNSVLVRKNIRFVFVVVVFLYFFVL